MSTESPSASSVLNTAAHGVVLLDETIADCNERFCRVVQSERAHIVGKSLLELSPEVQADGAHSSERWQRRWQAARAGLPQWFPWQFRAAEKRRVHALVHLTSDASCRNGLVAHVHDLSNLGNADWIRPDVRTRLQQVLDHTKAVIFVKDLDGRYVFANRELERVARMAAERIVGYTDKEIWPADVAERFRTNDAHVLRERSAAEFEVTADVGRQRKTFLSFKFPLFGADGEPYGVCGIATDITDRKRTQDALTKAALAVSSAQGASVFQELVRYLATILEVDAAFISTPHAGPGASRMRVQAFYMDGEIRDNFEYPTAGTPCETVLGQSFRIYASGLRDEFPREADFAQHGLESYAGFPLHDGSGLPLGLISVASRRPMVNAEFIESILQIFAVRAAAELERQQAEQALRQAQKMEALGHLTGGIAHDFNNLLTSIMGYVVLAADHPAAARDSKLEKYLEQAQRSCTRARDLIQQMLTFSRGQRGQPRPVSVPALVDESVKLFRSSLPSTLEVETRFEADVAAVMLDPVHLDQILLNLCLNARDAMSATGTIRVSVTPMKARGEICTACRKAASGEFVELCVTDDGAGIAPDILDRIFDPFFTTKDIGKGSGMGLASVHGIVHELGGHVLVETAPGRGTRFRVLFPALGEGNGHTDVDRTTRVRAPLTRLQGRILIVDDEHAVSAYMRDLLESWGLDATVANAPSDAVSLFARDAQRFHLVITDQAMPRMTGTQLARELIALRPDLPIILYTGFNEGIARRELDGAGLRAVMTKPIDPHHLYGLLQTHLPHAPA